MHSETGRPGAEYHRIRVFLLDSGFSFGQTRPYQLHSSALQTLVRGGDTMKHVLRTLCLAILGLALVVGASDSGDTKKDTGKKGTIPAGWKGLKLSKDQHDKVVGLSADYGVKIAALQKQIDDLKVQLRAEQVKVLTDDQKAILLKGLTGEDKKAPAKDAKDK
jgi:hypothetical protein